MREIIFWVLIAVSIPFVWRRPFLGLMIYLGFNIVRPEMLFWGGRTGGQVFSIYYALIVLASFSKGYFKKYRNAMQKEYLLMLWMMAAIFLSILCTQYDVWRNYYHAFELMKNLGICALIYMLVTEFSEIQRLQTALLSCFTFMGIWGIEQTLRGNIRVEGLGGNAWGDSNGVAAMFVLFLPVALARAYSSEKRRDFWIFFGMAAIMVALIVCTKSRGGLVGMLASLFSFGFYSRKTTAVIKIAIILALVVSPFASESYIERMKTMQETDTEDLEGSARSRLILWQAGLMVFADNPLIGTGFLTYPEAKMKYEGEFLYLEDSFRKVVFRTENKKVAHNTYIQILSDCGIAGGIPFLLLITWGIRAGFRARNGLREQPDNIQLLWLCGICAGLTGFAVCIIFINSVTSLLLFVQLVLIGILSRMTATSETDQSLSGQSLVIGEVQG